MPPSRAPGQRLGRVLGALTGIFRGGYGGTSGGGGTVTVTTIGVGLVVAVVVHPIVVYDLIDKLIVEANAIASTNTGSIWVMAWNWGMLSEGGRVLRADVF